MNSIGVMYFISFLRTSCHWKPHLSNFNLKIQAFSNVMLCCWMNNSQHKKAPWSFETSETTRLTTVSHPGRLWLSALQCWEPETSHNLSSVVPAWWLYKPKQWTGPTLVWFDVSFYIWIWLVMLRTLPAVQVTLCSLVQLQIFKPLAPSIGLRPALTCCDAHNTKVRYTWRPLIALCGSLNFHFLARHTTNLLPVPKVNICIDWFFFDFVQIQNHWKLPHLLTF